MKVSAHFDSSEFGSHDGDIYPSEWIETRLKPLAVVLEAIRAKVGKPIKILSGYRSPAHNKAIGGADKSQHMQGRAADLQVEGLTGRQLYAIVLSMYQHAEIHIGGLGSYETFCHVDIRDGRRLATWVL
jgi:uncharacterized protein YcbK (DUF882 family)